MLYARGLSRFLCFCKDNANRTQYKICEGKNCKYPVKATEDSAAAFYGVANRENPLTRTCTR